MKNKLKTFDIILMVLVMLGTISSVMDKNWAALGWVLACLFQQLRALGYGVK